MNIFEIHSNPFHPLDFNFSQQRFIKCTCKYEGPQIVKAILKKNKFGGLIYMLPDHVVSDHGHVMMIV